MSVALGKLAQEDPSFRVTSDAESGQTIIAGMGELHLDIIVDRMKREFGVEANVGRPQVAYRETIRDTIEVEGKFVRQTGGRGQYGHVWLRLEPLFGESGEAAGFEFVDEIVGGAVPREYISAVQRGIEQQMSNGVVAGYPLIGVKATLYDGSYHEVDSSEVAFRVAASQALRDGALRARPVLLEPVFAVEAVTPGDYLGQVVGDLNRRRGMIDGLDQNPAGKIVRAYVPLGEMFGYATDLRSATQGRRDVHDGVRAVRRSAPQHRRRGSSAGRGRVPSAQARGSPFVRPANLRGTTRVLDPAGWRLLPRRATRAGDSRTWPRRNSSVRSRT